MKLKPLLSFFLCLFFSISSLAQLFDGNSGDEIDVSDLISHASEGTIFVMGELHGFKPHHDNQREVLHLIREAPFDISVGMEFFEYPKQDYVDQYLNQEIEEKLFLQIMGWTNSLLSVFSFMPMQVQQSISFSHYRKQVLYPSTRGRGKTLAINLPRRISGKVAKSGLESLTPEEAQLLPPDFQLGNELYYERFKNAMGHHVPEESIPNYFLAHSLWDETMAWQVLNHLESHPNDFLMIIVGDFHVAYGHGLPARLRARGAKNVVVISQVKELEDAKSHPTYDARGDFVWVTP